MLLLVASSQVVVATTTDLTPWRGGGFGMFSTTDNHDQRFVRITVTTATGVTIPVDARALLETDSPVRDEFVRARAQPSTGNLDALAVAIADAVLIVEDGVVVPPTQIGHGEGSAPDVTTLAAVQVVHIQVHRVWFQRGANTLVPQRVIEARIET